MITVTMDNSWTYIKYPEDNPQLKKIVEDKLHTDIGVKQDNLQHNKAYRMGYWDGIVDFYDDKLARFPTGLVNDVSEILGELQNKQSFQFEIIDDRPDPLLTSEDIPDEPIELGEDITLRDYQMEAIQHVVSDRDGVLHISTGAGKTVIAAGLIKMALDKLESGETIGFFTHKKDIFNQTYKVLNENLDTEIGVVKSGKYNVKKINVVMVPTAASALRTDVEKGLNFSPKQMVIKKMAKKITPKYANGVNQRMLLKAHVANMEIKTKADERFKEEIEKVIEESESDAKCVFNLNKYTVWYDELLEKKNKDKYKKKKKMQDFLDTVVMGVWDEVHSINGDGYYNTAMACENSIMQVGLTGSIDEKNKMMIQRLKSVFHTISDRIKNIEMIEKDYLADIEVMMTPIKKVIVSGKEIDATGLEWQDAYESAIVQNEYRNALGAKIAQMWADRGETVLIVVSRIEHGERMSKLLEQLGVNYKYIHGESDQDFRDSTIQEARDGELDVLVSSTIIDEGVDIPNLSVLINLAGMKSIRTVLQRTGRVLRRKKDGRSAVVVDFTDAVNKYTYRHYNERLKIYKDEEFPIKELEG